MDFETYTKIALKNKYYAPSKQEFARCMLAIEIGLKLSKVITNFVVAADETILRDVVQVAVKGTPLNCIDKSYKRLIYTIVESY
jgi:hypothetical protein